MNWKPFIYDWGGPNVVLFRAINAGEGAATATEMQAPVAQRRIVHPAAASVSWSYDFVEGRSHDGRKYRTGRLPIGNTGHAGLSAFAPMPVPEDLQSHLGHAAP
ncbi:hypothetical protein CDQ91_07390 [Sphingopyxis witflariensis]|uniref:Uncharacterized protein n=1 Tax=Sphingopyxis witflariensis TaxID=173675 RepID=A0A246JYT0_9SPHN|nr:hypothetical protein CDQ91_07390 [Sphingopyxis witflariensis]